MATFRAPGTRLQPYRVRLVSFMTRDLADHGELEGFWTGEIDTWGKYTIRPCDGGPAHYLFFDEIVHVELPV